MRRARADERGFALVAVLLVLALLGVIGAEFAFSMRLEATMVRSYEDGVVAAHLAEAAVAQAVREILTDAPLVGTPDDEPLTFFRTVLTPLPRLRREAVPLGAGQFAYTITDEEARIDLTRTPPERVERLLLVLGLEKRVRDTIVDSLQDWHDANEEHRLNGAESEDTYLKLPLPYRSRNAPLEDIRELLQIHGMTPEIYYGHDRQPPLRDYVTVHATGQVNINTASEIVLKALGLSDSEVSDIVQSRRAAPYALPGRFTGRGLVATTHTFRIEAVGLVAGVPRARITAIVQKRAGTGGDPEVAILGWDPNADRPAASPVR
jgi:type II secretory pathway component PulK